MNNKNIISIAVLVIAFSIACYLIVVAPKNQQKLLRIEQDRMDQRIENNRINLDQCLVNVDKTIAADMQDWCKMMRDLKSEQPGIKGQYWETIPNCPIPTLAVDGIFEGWEKDKNEGRDECFKKYPID